MPQHNSYTSDYQFDAEGEDFGQGADTVSFPASVQRKIDHADSLLRGGDARENLPVIHQADLELARTDPVAFAAMMAARMGISGVSVSRQTKTVRTVQTERKVFGIRFGGDVQTTTDEFFEERSVNFGGNRGGDW